jgi:uncharacterized membrane protein
MTQSPLLFSGLLKLNLATAVIFYLVALIGALIYALVAQPSLFNGGVGLNLLSSLAGAVMVAALSVVASLIAFPVIRWAQARGWIRF